MINFSRLFVYYNEREQQKTTNSDSGSSLRIGIKTLVKYGDCTENLWPYTNNQFTVKPTATAYKEALNHQITRYYRLGTTYEMKHTLAMGYPFVFGFTVYESFESPKVAKTGIVPMPKKGERAIGGHAVLAVGYDEHAKTFLVRNSWGEGWGMKGYFTMPYAYLESLADDFWTIRK